MQLFAFLVLLGTFACVTGFINHHHIARPHHKIATSKSKSSFLQFAPNSDDNIFNPFEGHLNFDDKIDSTALTAGHSMSWEPLLVGLPMLLLNAEPAMADNAYGILAGRTASMMHPITNLLLFVVSLYSAYLGFQWRRLRDLSEEVKALSASLPKLSTTSAKFPLSEVKSALNAELSQLKASSEPNSADRMTLLQRDLAAIQGAADLDAKYIELTTTRKNLQQANLKDKHHATGSILLGAGVTVSLLGAFNTYMRAGRLFPGPHLYAGMAITILWALAAALVPYMQKGNEAARVAHISFNVINILLFAWQVPTGIEIMLKVWEKTSWP